MSHGQIFCLHASAKPWGYGGYIACGLCGKEWYATDPAPLVVIATSNEDDVAKFRFLREVRERQRDGGEGKVE